MAADGAGVTASVRNAHGLVSIITPFRLWRAVVV
jgi:hypothetical protein